MPESTNHRLSLVIILLGTATVLLLSRLLSVQVVNTAAYQQEAIAGRIPDRPLRLPDPPRGFIRDRNGFLLAGSEPRYKIIASPVDIPDPSAVVTELAEILNLPPGPLSATLHSEQTSVVLEPSATLTQARAIDAFQVPWLSTELHWQRVYPQGDLAGHVLGFVSDAGYYGVEGFYDHLLAPHAIVWEGETDALQRQPLPFDEGEIGAPQPGVDLELTLDLGVQTLAYQELARALEEFRAERGLVIVMDPRTGAVLAMVSLPGYDPGRYLEYDEEDWINPAISEQYEPGSVFKIVTMAAALDSGLVTPQTTYVDEGHIEQGGRVVTNWDGGAWGTQDMCGLLAHSLNVGAVWLVQQLGTEVFYRYVRAFGFGAPTGVDLQGEATGTVRTPADVESWHDSDLGSNSYGQGVAVTPLQMISAAAAVANEGRLMQPYVVSRQILPDGTVAIHQPVVRGQPISPETARTLSGLLECALENGAPLARVPGYRVAGKSGTASIPLIGGLYDERDTIASYVGYGPVENPQLVILVRLDRPQTSRWGSETAAVVFSRLAVQLFPLLGIPPDGAQ
jgi:cell division protein FtsI/penicillin-binding protein 2